MKKAEEMVKKDGFLFRVFLHAVEMVGFKAAATFEAGASFL